MFMKLTDTSKAAIFSVLVLCMSVGTALLIRFLGLSPGPGMWSLWSITPTVATLIMLLVVTRDGYSKEGWKSLGLHRLGLNVWWIAFGGTLLITVAASAIVWATPLASFVVPEDGIIDPILSFLIFFGMSVVWVRSGTLKRRPAYEVRRLVTRLSSTTSSDQCRALANRQIRRKWHRILRLLGSKSDEIWVRHRL